MISTYYRKDGLDNLSLTGHIDEKINKGSQLETVLTSVYEWIAE